MAVRAPFFPQLPAEALSAEEQLVAFSLQSEERLKGVNPALVDLMKEVEKRAQERGLDLEITEGVRDLERQEELLEEGKSQTLASKHLVGNALDVHLRGPDGSAIWDFEAYQPVAEIAKEVAAEKGIDNLVWGGDWKTLKDGVHFELSNAEYAAPNTSQAASNTSQATPEARRAQYGLGDRDPGNTSDVLQAVKRGDMTKDEAGKYVSEELLEGIEGASAYDLLQDEKAEQERAMGMLGQGLEAVAQDTRPAPPTPRSLPLRLSRARTSATPGTQAIGRFGLESLLRGNPLLGIR